MSEEEFEYQSLAEMADAMAAGGDPNAPPAIEVWQDYDPSMRFVAVFPITEDKGATSSTVAFYVFEPGNHSGLHSDNAEEVIYVAEGTGEMFVTGRQQVMEAGQFVVVPAGVQHDIYAYGDTALKLLSYFPVDVVESTFQDAVMPIGGTVMTSKLPRGPVVHEVKGDELPPELQHLAEESGDTPPAEG